MTDVKDRYELFMPDSKDPLEALKDLIRQLNNKHLDIAQDIVSVQAYSYVDRGDEFNSTYDWSVSDFTTDGTWKTGTDALDVSGIVPAGARSVTLTIRLSHTTLAQAIFSMRPDGSSNTSVVNRIRTESANSPLDGEFEVALNANRRIEYNGTNTTFSVLSIGVLGWRT